MYDNHRTRQQDGKNTGNRKQTAQCKTNTAKADETGHGNVTPKYTVNKTVEHVGTGDNNPHVV